MSKMFAEADFIERRQGPEGSNWRGKAAQRMCSYNKRIILNKSQKEELSDLGKP